VRRILKVNIDKCDDYINCNVYIKNDKSFEYMPSKKYIDAIRIMLCERENITNNTKDKQQQKILVRSLGDDGKIIIHNFRKLSSDKYISVQLK
jgi:hypothetical protein